MSPEKLREKGEEKPQEQPEPRRAVETPPIVYGVPPKYVGPRIPLFKPSEKSQSRVSKTLGKDIRNKDSKRSRMGPKQYPAKVVDSRKPPGPPSVKKD